MTNSNSDIRAQGDEGALVVRRVLDARRDLVFRAWSDPDHLARWWGPAGMQVSVASFDFRTGGKFHYKMVLPTGDVWWGRFVYREIVPSERLVFVSSFADAAGEVARAPFHGFPLETLSTITFEEVDQKTVLTVHGVPLEATEEERAMFVGMLESMQGGWAGTLEQLARHLAQIQSGGKE